MSVFGACQSLFLLREVQGPLTSWQHRVESVTADTSPKLAGTKKYIANADCMRK